MLDDPRKNECSTIHEKMGDSMGHRAPHAAQQREGGKGEDV
jgi:hypothetical protein